MKVAKRMKLKLPNRYVIFLMSVITLIILSGCSDSDAMREMDRADAVIDEHPDSALTILSAIDPTTLRTREGKARHSLLLSLAMLKEDYECDYDSIFSSAWAYFEKREDSTRETMLAHYTRALIVEGDNALEEYDKVIKLADDDDKYYEAVSWLNKGVIYRDNSSFSEARRCVDQAVEIINQTDFHAAHIHILYLSALLHNSMDEYDKSLEDINDAIKLSDEIGDGENSKQLWLVKARFHSDNGEHDKAVAIYSYLSEEKIPFSDEDIIAYARSLAFTDLVKSIEILDSTTVPEKDKGFYYQTRSQIYALNGNYKDAYSLMDSVLTYTDSLIFHDMRNELMVIQRDKKIMEMQHLKDIAEARRRESIYLGIIALFIVSFLIIFYRKRQLAHKNVIRDMTDTISHKNEIIEGKQEEINCIEEKVRTLSKSVDMYKCREEMLWNELLENFKEQHHSISNYCNDLVKDKGDNYSVALLKKLDSYLDPYRKPSFVSNIEKQINRIMENIICVIRESFEFNETEIAIIIYDICGFNYQAIGLLLSVSSKSAATKKSRLKKKLTEGMKDNEDIFKRYLPMMKSK